LIAANQADAAIELSSPSDCGGFFSSEERSSVTLQAIHFSYGSQIARFHAKGKEKMSEAGALETQVNQQIILAMKAHDAVRTTTLRLIKNALKNKFIETRVLLTPAEEQQALATMIKQRRDSIDQFTKGGRPELAAKEAAEIAVIEEFLPKALDDSALQALVVEAVAEVAAASGKAPTPKEMGQVMKAVQAKLQAASLRAEGRTVSELVKKALAG
jgi:uncharacterized protein YqeY